MDSKRFSIVFLAFFFCHSFLLAQSTIWTKSDESRVQLASYMERKVIPQKYDVWQADFQAIKNTLDNAPMEFTAAARTAPLTFEMPLPTYGLVRFKVVESPVYEAGLAKKYPQFKTFSAVGGDHNEFSARFDYTYNGFNAIVNTPEGEVYIDPFATDQKAFYITYFTKDYARKNGSTTFFCGADHEEVLKNNVSIHQPIQAKSEARTEGDLVTIRKYRLALAATGEFSSLYGGTKASVLSYLVTLTNRVTKKMSEELAMRFELIATNDTLVFLNAATDPYPKGNLGGAILSVSTAVINPRVGDANYDVGHTVTGGCTDVGGVANTNVICVKGSKGQGMSCDQGGGMDAFAVTIMCHEMGGHQFSASHTMSSCGSGDQSQVASSNKAEPGSGVTIMSYDGGCGNDNVTGQYWKSNGYYNTLTLEQIMNFSRRSVGNTCPQKIVTANHEPIVNIPLADGFQIPIGTPFEMTAKATDEDGDALKFCWEQADNGTFSSLGTPKTLEANTFRSFDPTSNPTRIFPQLPIVLGNVKPSKAELYPDTTRDYTFRCTVRDYNINGGGTVWDEVKFKSTHKAGPFTVNYPATDTDTLSNSEYTLVKWSVANTDKAPVNCQRVNILLSTDGGLTFPTVLLKNTINDGEEGVIIPSNITSNKVRIKVAAADNIFFNISKQNHSVVASNKKGYTFTASSEQYIICLPDVANVDIQTSVFGGYSNKINLSIVGALPQGATATFAKSQLNGNESTTLSVDMNKVNTQGVYAIKIRSIAGTDTLYRSISFKTVYANFSDMTLAVPADGATGLTTLPSFKWNPAAVADSYDFELATSPTFAPNTIVFKKENTKATDINAPVTLLENTLYFWHVRAKNTCRSGDFSSPSAFSTLLQTCKDYKKDDKLNIGSSSKASYESNIEVFEAGKISDLNITNIQGNHDDFGDLEMIVASPTGKTSTLFSKKCATISATFNLGFDDQAATPFNCSLVNSSPYFKPVTPLSVFNGEETKGIWALKINDTKVGDGGQLTNWNLRFCFSTSVIPPKLIKNDTLRCKKGLARYIDNATLEATDDKSSASKVTYTLVQEPENGKLDKWAVPVKVGDVFSQQDLNQSFTLRYTNNANATSNTDYFLFVVTDGDGGFIGTYRYNIVRDSKAPAVSAFSLDVAQALQVYPNPTNNTLNVTLQGENLGKTDFSLYNLQGQLIENQSFTSENITTTFDVQTLAEGIYLLQVSTAQGQATKKIVVARTK